MELDDSLWLVSKEKEINFELKDFLGKPPSFHFLDFAFFFKFSKVAKNCLPLFQKANN